MYFIIEKNESIGNTNDFIVSNTLLQDIFILYNY